MAQRYCEARGVNHHSKRNEAERGKNLRDHSRMRFRGTKNASLFLVDVDFTHPFLLANDLDLIT
jgi:hypothetical protein